MLLWVFFIISLIVSLILNISSQVLSGRFISYFKLSVNLIPLELIGGIQHIGRPLRWEILLCLFVCLFVSFSLTCAQRLPRLFHQVWIRRDASGNMMCCIHPTKGFMMLSAQVVSCIPPCGTEKPHRVTASGLTSSGILHRESSYSIIAFAFECKLDIQANIHLWLTSDWEHRGPQQLRREKKKRRKAVMKG